MDAMLVKRDATVFNTVKLSMIQVNDDVPPVKQYRKEPSMSAFAQRNWFWMILALPVLCLSLSSCGSNQPVSKTVDVTQLVDDERYDEAVTLLEQALTDHPTNPDLLYNLASVEYLQNKLSQARDTALKALAYAQNDDGILLLLAEIALDVGRVQEAWDRLLALSQEGRQSANAQLLLGSLHAQQQEWAQAEEAFRIANQLGAPAAMVKASLAYVLLQQQKNVEGQAVLTDADAMLKKSENALRQIAECYLLLKNGQEAKRIAYSLHPEQQNDARLWSIIGRANLLMLSFGEAESAFTRALASQNTTPWNLVEYAVMLVSANREDEALQKAVEAEELLNQSLTRVTNPAIYNLLATIHAKQGQAIAAQQYLERSLAVEPNQPKVQELLFQLTEPVSSEPALEEVDSVTVDE
jgi:tetratricopeptide (TPR) repeat protein